MVLTFGGLVSDGPHRSLPMTRGWKRLAERADSRAYEPEEIGDALPAALAQDWNAEVPAGLLAEIRKVVGDRQKSLLGDDRLDRLEALRTLAAGRALSGVLLDCAMQAVVDGHCGDDAIKKATANALGDRAARRSRQVEEHYLRKSSGRRAVHVRHRIEDGVNRADVAAIAGQLLGFSSAKGNTRPKLKSGLDQGVSL